jgi:hypothetical protein
LAFLTFPVSLAFVRNFKAQPSSLFFSFIALPIPCVSVPPFIFFTSPPILSVFGFDVPFVSALKLLSSSSLLHK